MSKINEILNLVQEADEISVSEGATVLELIKKVEGFRSDLMEVARNHRNDDAQFNGDTSHLGKEIQQIVSAVVSAEMKLYNIVAELRESIGLPGNFFYSPEQIAVGENTIDKVQEGGSAVATKPVRLCSDCADDVLGNDPEMNDKINRLSHRDKEVLQWRCVGKGCYSRAEYKIEDGDAYETARKLNPVRRNYYVD